MFGELVAAGGAEAAAAEERRWQDDGMAQRVLGHLLGVEQLDVHRHRLHNKYVR
jgi:hypothetical protein